MKILAFESSAKAAGVAIIDDGALLGEYFQNSGQTHSRTLMQMAQNLIENCDLTAQDIDACAVANGPGSFTGVRIGVAAAKGFCWGREIPCYGVSTLEAMARGAACMDGIFCCCMDARREQVYNALFQVQGGSVTRLSDDRAISIAELGEDLGKIDAPIFLVGDGAQLCHAALKDTIKNLILLPEHLRQQRAAGIGLGAWEKVKVGADADPASLTPNYLRLSQAERARLEKLKAEPSTDEKENAR